MDSFKTIHITSYLSVAGTMRSTGRATSVVIFVHGFLSHSNEHIFFNGSKYLSHHGYDSFRFDLCSFTTQPNKTTETSIKTHAELISGVVAHFRKLYTSVHIVGHSLGCPIILLSELSGVASLVFWEPSIEPKDVFRKATQLTNNYFEIPTARFSILLEKRILDEARSLKTIPELLRHSLIPLLIITAGNAGWRVGQEMYYKNANQPKQLYMIPNSGHNFDEDGAEEILLKETVAWLSRWK